MLSAFQRNEAMVRYIHHSCLRIYHRALSLSIKTTTTEYGREKGNNLEELLPCVRRTSQEFIVDPSLGYRTGSVCQWFSQTTIPVERETTIVSSHHPYCDVNLSLASQLGRISDVDSDCFRTYDTPYTIPTSTTSASATYGSVLYCLPWKNVWGLCTIPFMAV